VGTAIANAALRPPVLAAKTAAQLDQASDGRFLLGLGVANDVMNGRFGLTPVPPLRIVAEYVGVVRSVLAGDPGFAGQVFSTGMVPLDSPPVRTAVPIYLAALGPRMLELAGRIADGVILNLMSPAQAREAVGLVRAAAVAAGRSAKAVEIACVVHTCVADAPDVGAAAAREVVPRYILHPSVGRLFGAHDEAGSLAGARDRTLAGDRTGAAQLVSQQVADAFVAYGDADAVGSRLADYLAAGVDLPIVFPMPVAGDWGYERVIESLSGQVAANKDPA
jgi:alkanesulfonate monooxygenase SsuD/methylene tetrahydromethanopterin reductase-like flavin-dependent oxidoreductase (luciferase family)